MFKKTMIAGLVATALAPAVSVAADSPHTLTGNVGLYSQYIFRGLTQTNKEPALQGGFDYSHSSGFYAGVWASNISWLRDFGSYSAGGSVEIDFYGGLKGSIGKSDFGYDIGLLQYYYPGDVAPGFVKADTLELYGALTWKWLSAKYSHSLNNKTFGVADSRGTYYLDLSANFPVTDKLTLSAHWGKQKFDGGGGPAAACGAGVKNDTCASYEDWKIGASYALPQGFTVGGFFTGTDMTAAQKAFYTTPAAAGSRWIGKDAFTVFLSKSF
jgi:uncharacterized protein (TIGR02001 family)